MWNVTCEVSKNVSAIFENALEEFGKRNVSLLHTVQECHQTCELIVIWMMMWPLVAKPGLNNSSELVNVIDMRKRVI